MRSNGHTFAQKNRLMSLTMKDQNETIQQILAEHPSFKELEPHHRLFIADCASPISFEAGTYLAREGEASTKFYLILRGQVDIGILTTGRGFTKLQHIGHNELVGWSWLMPPRLPPLTPYRDQTA